MELENIRNAEAAETAFLEGWEASDGPEDGTPPPQDPAPSSAAPSEPDAPPGPLAPAGPIPPAGAGIPGLANGTGLPGGPAGAGIPGPPMGMPPREARIQADLRAFAETFPDAANDPWSIPREVWDMARRGGSLTAAYSAWSAAARRNAENAARSAGSMRSAGAGSGPRDPFLEGWNE